MTILSTAIDIPVVDIFRAFYSLHNQRIINTSTYMMRFTTSNCLTTR